MSAARHPAGRRVPLRPRRARRDHAAPRSGRGPDPHRALLPGLGGRRRVQRGARAAPLLRPAHRGRDRLCRQRGRPAARGLHPPGWRRHVARSLGARTTASAGRFATGSTSPSAASASAARSASPTAATRRPSQLRRGRRRLGRTCSATLGVRWFHTGGIFAALSETTPGRRRGGGRGRGAPRHRRLLRPELPAEPVEGDRRRGARARGQPPARGARRRDDRQRGGLHRLPRARGRGVDERLAELDSGRVPRDDRARVGGVPELRRSSRPRCARFAARRSTTGRRSPGRATAGFVEATARPGLEILDRVGGGDSFASGLIYGLLEHGDLQPRNRIRRAHGALAMTTPGDTSTARLEEVEALVKGTGARVQR